MLTSANQVKTLAASIELYSMLRNLGSLLLWPTRYLSLMPVSALVNVHCCNGMDVFASCDDVESCKEGVILPRHICLEVDIVLQKTLPCEVALLVVLLKRMMMADVGATWVGADVRPEAVVAAK